MEDIVYFELNNWFSGRDYPNVEPFLTWMTDTKLDQYFLNDDWVKEQGLCVVHSFVDMSCNFCITAKRSWVESVIPDLLTDKTVEYTTITTSKDGTIENTHTNSYSSFIRQSKNGDTPVGRFGCPFLEYSKENIGIKYWDEDKCDFVTE